MVAVLSHYILGSFVTWQKISDITPPSKFSKRLLCEDELQLTSAMKKWNYFKVPQNLVTNSMLLWLVFKSKHVLEIPIFLWKSSGPNYPIALDYVFIGMHYFIHS